MAPYEIDDKFVIAVASSALFDLSESDRVYREKGTDAYRQYQRDHEEEVLRPGSAFPLVKGLLSLNDLNMSDSPVEVILLSRNDPDTGLRVFNSIEAVGLNITRAAFLSGADPFRYVDAFNACLFLSADEKSVEAAVQNGVPAGRVFPTNFTDDDTEIDLRIAFDFDGVIADDSAESVNQQLGLAEFQESEKDKALEPLPTGPLHRFLTEVAKLQRQEREANKGNNQNKPKLRIAIITARNAPAHKRMVTSLRRRGIEVDETFFLGGIDKFFFDDQMMHIKDASQLVPSAHVPFGIANRTTEVVDQNLDDDVPKSVRG